ncbi:hypothetical protein [Massilia timonae]|uniref:hypothetical protein n=1 Tax=Massilia timonae TaxID=47229 RepID=UPI0028D41754|nr:hypothetical protein [Massilia timonae]
MKDTKVSGTSVPDLVKAEEVQTSALPSVPQRDPAKGGSYIREVSTGELIKRAPVRELKVQE